jgi:hypothetical protein
MNHPGEMSRLGAICRPTIGMITTVGPGHLEFLGSLEGVARAKGELIARIDPEGTVVLNRDDPLVRPWPTDATGGCSFSAPRRMRTFQARNIREEAQGIAFDLLLPSSQTIEVNCGPPGAFMVTNALAAAAAGFLVGVPAPRSRPGLESFVPDKGRLHIVPHRPASTSSTTPTTPIRLPWRRRSTPCAFAKRATGLHRDGRHAGTGRAVRDAAPSAPGATGRCQWRLAALRMAGTHAVRCKAALAGRHARITDISPAPKPRSSPMRTAAWRPAIGCWSKGRAAWPWRRSSNRYANGRTTDKTGSKQTE